MIASVSRIASTREECEVASPWVMRRRGWLRSSGGSLEGLRRKAVTRCCLLRHAARAAEPTRPAREGCVSVRFWFCRVCGKEREMCTCSADDEDLHGREFESVQVMDLAAKAINPHWQRSRVQWEKLAPGLTRRRRCVPVRFRPLHMRAEGVRGSWIPSARISTDMMSL